MTTGNGQIKNETSREQHTSHHRTEQPGAEGLTCRRRCRLTWLTQYVGKLTNRDYRRARPSGSLVARQLTPGWNFCSGEAKAGAGEPRGVDRLVVGRSSGRLWCCPASVAEMAISGEKAFH